MNVANLVVATPKVGQSVYVPFVTITDPLSGKADYLGGCATIPFDKIAVVYSDSKTTGKKGQKIYGVGLKSGDRVEVVLKEQNERQTLWQALS